jgi:hypothetical protein
MGACWPLAGSFLLKSTLFVIRYLVTRLGTRATYQQPGPLQSLVQDPHAPAGQTPGIGNAGEGGQPLLFGG